MREYTPGKPSAGHLRRIGEMRSEFAPTGNERPVFRTPLVQASSAKNGRETMLIEDCLLPRTIG